MNCKIFALLICMCCLTLGCGGDGRPTIVPVEGTLTLDGEPLGGARLGFLPTGDGDFKRPGKAHSDSAGHFVVGTYTADDGLAPGTYTVTVEKKEIVGEIPEDYNMEDPAANAKPLKYNIVVPVHYGDPNESGLTVEVTSEGLQPATIAITSDGQTGVQSVGGSSNEP